MTVVAYIIRLLGKEKKKYTLKGIVNAVIGQKSISLG